MQEDNFICARHLFCQEWECEGRCLAYGDCFWCENKKNEEKCGKCKHYEEGKNYEPQPI